MTPAMSTRYSNQLSYAPARWKIIRQTRATCMRFRPTRFASNSAPAAVAIMAEITTIDRALAATPNVMVGRRLARFAQAIQNNAALRPKLPPIQGLYHACEAGPT